VTGAAIQNTTSSFPADLAMVFSLQLFDKVVLQVL
jgi:hypothetical protein